MRRTFVAFLLVSACALAQDKPATPAPAAAPAAAPSFREVFLNRLADTETKLVSLADATPQEKLAWRPGEGVRSVGEVFMHIAGANYLFMVPLGAKPPAGINPGMEKSVTAKADIVSELKKSFAHVRLAVEGLSDADMPKPTKMFGRTMTYEGVLFVMANHMHEHFGQSIAYARTNGIVPPWSKKEN